MVAILFKTRVIKLWAGNAYLSRWFLTDSGNALLNALEPIPEI